MRKHADIFMHDPFVHLGSRDDGVHGRGNSPVRLYVPDRRRHLLISGRSGTGKSTLISNLFSQEADSGRGALLIDPHGDIAEQAINLIPSRRIRKTIYINPSDLEWPVGFNVLHNVPIDERPARSADLVEAFKAVWGDSWGPRMQYILYMSIATLMENSGTTLLCIQRLLLKADYRQTITRNLTDPVLAQFWREEFPLYEKKFHAEAVSPILNKVGALLAAPAVRNILGQTKTTFHPRILMDKNYLVVVNLSRIGAQHANLIGALLIASFGAAALSRSDIPEVDRRDFVMFIDEFPKFTTTALAGLLSEARKFRLALVLAHQYLAQMHHTVRDAVFGNVGSIIAFNLGPQDTEVFGRELDLRPDLLTDTPNHQAWYRILQHDHKSSTYRLLTPPPPKPHSHGQKVIQQSRMNFATARHKVEERIKRFLAAYDSSKKKRDKSDW